MKTFVFFDQEDCDWLVPVGMKPGNSGPCRGCGKLVLWVTTKAGKRMPLNGNGTSHFASCPKAEEFRSGPPPFAGIETI